MDRIKVFIVDDSLFMRRVLTEIISADHDFEVIGSAPNGKIAISKIPSIKPDCITLDYEMPEMDGLETLKHIMQNFPTPVLMLSTYTYKGAKITIEALREGAIDFVHKPEGISPEDFNAMAEELVQKIKTISSIPLRKLNNTTSVLDKKDMEVTKRPVMLKDKIIAIGISTGGPSALHKIMENISADLDACILITQHMPEGFTKELANSLGKVCPLTVKEAENNEILTPGKVLIAPGATQLSIRKTSTGQYSAVVNAGAPPESGHKPSADILFSSVATHCSSNALGIIMTGMGRDGATGIGKIKRAGGIAVAQDEESCIVYGMPQVAVEEGNVDKSLSLTEILNEINWFGSK